MTLGMFKNSAVVSCFFGLSDKNRHELLALSSWFSEAQEMRHFNYVQTFSILFQANGNNYFADSSELTTLIFEYQGCLNF